MPNKISCNLCPKTFASSNSLFFHKQIHSGVKYNCPECNKSFSSSPVRYIDMTYRLSIYRHFWKISISISISIRRSWKYRYLKRILTKPLSTFMDVVVNCIEWHSMKFIQKIIHFCAQGLPGLSLNYFFIVNRQIYRS